MFESNFSYYSRDYSSIRSALDKIRIGVTERGSLKIFDRSSKAAHNIKLSLAYSEFTVHMQNQLKAGSFVETKAGLSHDVQFFSRAMK